MGVDVDGVPVELSGMPVAPLPPPQPANAAMATMENRVGKRVRAALVAPVRCVLEFIG